MTKLEKHIIEHVKAECKKYKVKFYIGKGKYLLCNGIKVNGYFDSDELVLAISLNTPNWLLILSHEYSHMLQYFEQCKEWKYYEKSLFDFVAFIEGSKVSKKYLNKSIETLIDLERDCEVRSSNFLSSVGYDKIDVYIQKANAYTLFYYYMKENKVWYKIGKEPYNLPKVWKKFPKTFNIDKKAVYNELKNNYVNCV